MGAFFLDVSVPKHWKESVEVVIFGPARTRETTRRRVFVDTPAPETSKELGEVVILVQQEHMQRQTDEHFSIFVPDSERYRRGGEFGPTRKRATTD